jgi:hypothetical protein
MSAFFLSVTQKEIPAGAVCEGLPLPRAPPIPTGTNGAPTTTCACVCIHTHMHTHTHTHTHTHAHTYTHIHIHTRHTHTHTHTRHRATAPAHSGLYTIGNLSPSLTHLRLLHKRSLLIIKPSISSRCPTPPRHRAGCRANVSL